jgi:hypothetical protein
MKMRVAFAHRRRVDAYCAGHLLESALEVPEHPPKCVGLAIVEIRWTPDVTL